MNKEPLPWIIFIPGEEQVGEFISDVAQAVRLSYRGVVEAGLRNPELDFDPADYFGYMLIFGIPTGREDEPHAYSFVFGLVHKDHRPLFDGADKGRTAHKLPPDQVLAVTSRLIAYEIRSFFTGNFTFPMKIHQHKKWKGLNGWMSGNLRYTSASSLVSNTVKYLLTVPVMTDEKAMNATANLMKKFQGGGK